MCGQTALRIGDVFWVLVVLSRNTKVAVASVWDGAPSKRHVAVGGGRGCSFDEMLELSEGGDNAAVDMLVGDIYGGLDYEKVGEGDGGWGVGEGTDVPLLL